MFSTDFIFRQQENLVDNQKCWAGFRPLCNKILFNIVQQYAGLLEVYHIVLILFRFFFTMHYALQTLQYDKVRSF